MNNGSNELHWAEKLLARMEEDIETEFTLTLRRQHFIEIIRHHIFQLKELEKAIG